MLQPRHFVDEDAEESLKELALFYKTDVDSEQTMAEYNIYRRMYYQSWQGVAGSPNTLEQMCELLVHTCLETAFPNICALLKVSVTLPVSTAGMERGFCRLNLIKTYLHSTMSQERLFNLSLLPVSTVGVERSFCRLKLIKTYLRSTMGQERLSNLSCFPCNMN